MRPDLILKTSNLMTLTRPGSPSQIIVVHKPKSGVWILRSALRMDGVRKAGARGPHITDKARQVQPQTVPSVVHRPAALASLGNLLKMQNLGP